MAGIRVTEVSIDFEFVMMSVGKALNDIYPSDGRDWQRRSRYAAC